MSSESAQTGAGGSDSQSSLAKDLTDGREPGDWKTRYPEQVARSQIRNEFRFLISLLLIDLLLVFLTWTHLAVWLSVQRSQTRDFEIYTTALLGGALGGATFSLKWLYHSVAKWKWNADRWIWRYTTPFISAAFSVTLVALVRSNLLRIVDPTALSAMGGVLAFSFLTGYFSDNVIGAMLRFAEHIFGTVRVSEERSLGRESPPGGPGSSTGAPN